MAAQVTFTNNEDGILTPEISIMPAALRALEELGACMDKAVVRVRPLHTCSKCGDDARYEAKKHDGQTIYLCQTHVDTTYDWNYAVRIP